MWSRQGAIQIHVHVYCLYLQSKKSQSGNISLIWGEAPTISFPTETKICMFGIFADQSRICKVPRWYFQDVRFIRRSNFPFFSSFLKFSWSRSSSSSSSSSCCCCWWWWWCLPQSVRLCKIPGVCLFVCVSVKLATLDLKKTTERIFMIILPEMYAWTRRTYEISEKSSACGSLSGIFEGLFDTARRGIFPEFDCEKKTNRIFMKILPQM